MGHSTGSFFLTLNSVSAFLLDGSESRPPTEGYSVVFGRKLSTINTALNYPREPRLPEKTWTLRLDIEDDEFIWFMNEDSLRALTPEELSKKVVRELAHDHDEYEQA